MVANKSFLAKLGFALVCAVVLCSLRSAHAQVNDSGTSRSPHGNLNIPCQNCHTSISWKPIRAVPEFDHNRTSYPLIGGHENVACTRCHAKPVFANTGTRCADCHADIHRRQMGASCERCHTVQGWNVTIRSVQNHENRFPLVGAHAALECDSCHKGAAAGQFQGLSFQCYSCHASDFQQTNAPSHATAGFPATCEQCHAITTWFGAKFDHLKLTGFALTGTHASLQCNDCHLGGKFKGTPAACAGCHMNDYRKASNPNHVAFGFPVACQDCHSTSLWQPASVNHAALGFPLSGRHATLQCNQCHINNNYNVTSTACVFCHLADYQGAKNPNHVAGGMPQQCEVCHSTFGWSPAQFDHSRTGFPLTGFHTNPAVTCAMCHVNNNYNLTSTACVSCHLKDYQGTNAPNHAASGIPQQCDVCHSTTAWIPASFNHNNTAFPLTGFHANPSVTCAMCHINNNYTSIPTDCYSCHKADYNATNNPNHVAAGFPTTCATCHSTASWLNATFNHTWFPTNHGGAGGVCATCHTNPNDYTVFTCTNCHTKAQTDSNHRGVGGYVYNSVNCYNCHKNGGGGG